jgi:hypothetical protein
MSWQTVSGKLVKIAESCEPHNKKKGNFSHDVAGAKSIGGGKFRRFWFEPIGGKAEGPATMRVTRFVVDTVLCVEYPDSYGNSAEIDEIIIEDSHKLIKAFSYSCNWGRNSESKCNIVSVDSRSDSIGKYEIERGEGYRRLKINLSVRYQNDAS